MKNYIRQIIQIFTSTSQNTDNIREVHQWLISPDHFEEKETALQELWLETDNYTDENIRKSLDAVYRKAGIVKSINIKLIRFIRYAVAAGLLIGLISATYLFTRAEYSHIKMVEDYTHAGDMHYIDLPDGSKVQTNSGTILLYPEKFTGKERTVFLLGEANFKIAQDPDKSFIVRSNTLSVTALGTEFNVKSYTETNEVVATLIEGKVRVDCGISKDSFILDPGQQVTYQVNSGKSHISIANIEDVTAWQNEILVFRSVTVKEMLITLQRRFNISIQYNDNLFNNDKYNLRFTEKATIQEVFAIMKEVIGDFDYTVENGCYIIQ